MKRMIAVIMMVLVLSGCTKPVDTVTTASQTEDGINVTITAEDNWTELKFLALGTYVQMRIFDMDPEKAAPILKEAASRIDDYERTYSVQIEDSALSAINKAPAQEPIAVSEETLRLLEKAQYYYQVTEGHFDISILPIVERWGIGTEYARVPEQDVLKEAMETSGLDKVLVDQEAMTVTFTHEGMGLDLGGIAKGYIGDEIRMLLEEHEVASAFINLGGNIVVVGSKEDGSPWRIGVQDPNELRGAFLGILDIYDESIVTSGGYERFFEQEGQVYHHILNPFTGHPADTGLLSVTIVSRSSTDADALSTSCFMLGLEKGMALVDSLDTVEAVFVTEDKNIFITRGLRDRFELRSSEYILMED